MTVHIAPEMNAVVGYRDGFDRFIYHPDLSSDRSLFRRRYLCEDEMYFKVSVIAANHKPWLKCFS